MARCRARCVLVLSSTSLFQTVWSGNALCMGLPDHPQGRLGPLSCSQERQTEETGACQTFHPLPAGGLAFALFIALHRSLFVFNCVESEGPNSKHSRLCGTPRSLQQKLSSRKFEPSPRQSPTSPKPTAKARCSGSTGCPTQKLSVHGPGFTMTFKLADRHKMMAAIAVSFAFFACELGG